MKNRRRVLLLIKGLGAGGAERLLAEAVPHLDRTRFDYEIAYVLPWKDALVGVFQGAEIPVHTLGTGGLLRPSWVRRLISVLRAGRFDVIDVHSPAIAVAARVAARVAVSGRRPRVVYTEHNLWDRYHPLTRWLNAWTLGLNDHVLCVSEAVRRSIRTAGVPGWWPRPKVEVLRHGIDLQRVHAAVRGRLRAEFSIPANAPIVGTVGNLKQHKGHTVLLEAARLVLDEIHDCRFVVVGTGPEEEMLLARVGDLGIRHRVFFTGFRPDALDLLSNFDIFVMSSIQEGLPIALLEAMALGVPAVCTAVGGIPEVVDSGVNGVLVAPGDGEQLGRAILKLLADEPLRSELGTESRRRAKGFSIERTVRSREDLYEMVLS